MLNLELRPHFTWVLLFGERGKQPAGALFLYSPLMTLMKRRLDGWTKSAPVCGFQRQVALHLIVVGVSPAAGGADTHFYGQFWAQTRPKLPGADAFLPTFGGR